MLVDWLLALGGCLIVPLVLWACVTITRAQRPVPSRRPASHGISRLWRVLARGGDRLHLKVRFLTIGWRWPLRDEDQIEVWDGQTHECLGAISGAMIRHLVAHHLSSAQLQQAFTRDLTRPALPDLPRKPLAEIDDLPWTRAQRAAKRTKRRKP